MALVKKQVTVKVSFLDKLETYLSRHAQVFFICLLSLTLLTSLLLFDARISLGGDDSAYVERASNFVNNNIFPSYQGALYPVVISIAILVFGVNLIAIKLFSVVFALGHVFFMFKAFKGRIPYTVLFSVLFFIAINKFINYYSSQTYSESFFLFVQAATFYVFFRLLDKLETDGVSLRNVWPRYLWLGFCLFALSITKNIAIVALLVVALYFLLNKQWLSALCSVSAFFIFKIPYSVITKLVYHVPPSNQINQLMLKDFYRPEMGNEDVVGYVFRFLINFSEYISRHTFRILGLRPDSAKEQIVLLALLVFVLFIIVYISNCKKNKYVKFTGLYLAALAAASFIALQIHWSQDRIILILVPMLLLFLLYGWHQWSIRSSYVRPYYILFILLLLILNIFSTAGRVSKNMSILKKNLEGDVYCGYTPDITNFLKMSRWCADNLPKDAVVASRKAPMSFLYGKGKQFYAIYKVSSTNADSLLLEFKKAHVSYMIVASIRLNADKADGNIINTMHRIAYFISEKYPEKIKVVHQIGNTEPAYLLQIIY